MRRATETIARQWELLSLIPREPRTISAAELHSRLADRGYDVDLRTVQRDLSALERRFALRLRTEGRTNFWFWSRNQVPLEIPAMSNVAAITFLLVREYLLPLLPPAAISELNGYFVKAAEQLKGTKFARWRERACMLRRGPTLLAPDIDPAVRDAVYGALLDNRRLEIEYRSRENATTREMKANPLALVVKDGVFYLVATLWGYDDVRQLALHRIERARQLDDEAKSSKRFRLQEYLKGEAFAYRVSPAEIKLRVLFDADAAHHLLERRLSPTQTLRANHDGSILLEARVPDTLELRWWLLGFGAQVEVHSPAHLRREFQEVSLAMAARYVTKKRNDGTHK